VCTSIDGRKQPIEIRWQLFGLSLTYPRTVLNLKTLEGDRVNGFVKRQIDIGSKQPIHQLQLCNKCEEKRPPEGGIQMNPSKWYCASCWAKKVTVRNLK